MVTKTSVADTRRAYNIRMPIFDRRPSVRFILALAVVAGACQSKPGASPTASSSAPSATTAVSADAWAVVDGREIRRDYVEKAYRRNAPLSPAPSVDEALAAKLNLLDQLIVEDLMLAKARELKIELADKDLDQAFADGKKNIADDAFNKELSARNLTAADMREGLRRDLLLQKVIEREVASKISITDQDVTDYFQANKAQFNLPEDSYRIAQIVVTAAKEPNVTNRKGDDAATPAAALTKAQMLMGRLKSGTPFSELAMDYSEDPETAPRGGDIGLVPVSALKQAPPQLRDAVMKAQPGGVNLVSMEGGHTIVAVIAKQAAGQRDPSMPEVKDGITNTLRGQRELILRAAYVAEVRNKANVVNLLARQVLESPAKLPASLLSAPSK